MYLLTKLARNKIVVSAILFLMAFLLVGPVLTAPPLPGTPGDINLGIIYGEKTGLGKQDVRETISKIIRVAMGLLGVVALVIVLVGGFKWMTAGGNEEKVGEAKKVLFAGIIGLAIIFASYALANFILKQLYSATTGIEKYEVEVGV